MKNKHNLTGVSKEFGKRGNKEKLPTKLQKKYDNAFWCESRL